MSIDEIMTSEITFWVLFIADVVLGCIVLRGCIWFVGYQRQRNKVFAERAKKRLGNLSDNLI